MENIFFKVNNYKQQAAQYSKDYFLPVSISIESSVPYSEDIFYVQFNDGNNLTMLTLGTTYGEIYDLKVVYSQKILFYEKPFDNTKYLSWQMANYLNLEYNFKPSTGIKQTIIIDKACNLEIYNNAVKINLPNGDAGRYLFYQSSTFAIITDFNLCVSGFIFIGLTKTDYQELVDYALKKNLSTIVSDTINNGNALPMNDYKYAIKKIFELNKIDLWKLIAYGYKINLVDDKFLIDFSSEKIMKNASTDFLAIDIAALSKNKAGEAGILLLKKIDVDSIGLEEKNDYNNVWLYVSTVFNLSEKGIL